MMPRADTRQQILDAASELFHTRSDGDAGVVAVCERAGVSKGSIFHFFRSKRDLALAVLEQFRQRIGETAIAKAFSPRLPPMERRDCFVTGLYAFQKALADEFGHPPGCPFGNMAMGQATQDELLRQKADGILRSLAKHVQAVISDAIQCAAIPPVDEEATAEAMLG